MSLAPPMQDAALPDPSEVLATSTRLFNGAFTRIYSLGKVSGYVLMLGGPSAFVVGLISGDRLGGVAFGLVVVGVGSMIVLSQYAKRNLRRALEVFNDHWCHERAEWQSETGGKMPSGIKGAERWLEAHPTGRGRASLLLALGRVAELDAVLASYVPDTPEHTFDVKLLRETRSLYLGGTPDVDGLRADLATLSDPRERRHRRECIAMLEAQWAVAQSRDPIAVLAQARSEVDDVYWRYKSIWALGILLAAAVLLVVFGGVLGGSIGFRGLS